MDTKKYNLETAEKYALAMMKQGHSTPDSIRSSARHFKLDASDLANHMELFLDFVSMKKKVEERKKKNITKNW